MSEVQQAKVPHIATGVVALRGKVDASRRHESYYYTRMVIPAINEYESPSTVELRSRNRVGDPDEMINVRAKVGGYRKRPYRFTDRDTGESRMVVPVVVTLDVIEE